MIGSTKYIIFADIDATLLDYDTYQFKAHDLIHKLKETEHMLILNSSKTAAEIKKLMHSIKHIGSFICENGAAIYITKDFHVKSKKVEKGYSFWNKIVIGINYKDLVQKFNLIKTNCNYLLKGFSDMSIKEIMHYTSLNKEAALLAKNREHSEPFIVLNKKAPPLKELRRIVKKYDLNIVKGGRFYHLIGNHDKGKAAKTLIRIIKKELKEEYKIISIGDSQNDFPMLKIADIPILMPKNKLEYEKNINLKNIVYAKEAGSEGFASLLNKIIFGNEI